MPPPLPVIWSPRAKRNVDAILVEIAVEAPRAAVAMASRLTEAGDSLELFPERGRQSGKVRELVIVRPYVIRYRITDRGVVILRVKHGAQQG